MSFLRGKHAVVLTALLLVQGTLFYATAMREEKVPAVRQGDRCPGARTPPDLLRRRLQEGCEPWDSGARRREDPVGRHRRHGPVPD